MSQPSLLNNRNRHQGRRASLHVTDRLPQFTGLFPNVRRRSARSLTLLTIPLIPRQYRGSPLLGPVAQLGEHLVCNQGVGSSSLPRSTNQFNNLRVSSFSEF